MRRIISITVAEVAIWFLTCGCAVNDDGCDEECEGAIQRDACVLACIARQSDPRPKDSPDGGRAR